MIKYSRTNNPADCYGCGACEQICGHNALVLIPNSDGFLYPKIDYDKCTNCGLCEKVCPIDIKPKGKVIQTIAAQYQDPSLMDSSSGGMFKAAADYVLANSGYVAGCVFDESFNAIHILSNSTEDIFRMQGSKYVQSKIGDVYKQIRQKLKENILVLFSGTPCQVAGLNEFLMKDYHNLITIDLICHGVPSPELFQKYLNSTYRKKNKVVVDFKFRNKRKNGWCSQGSVITKSKDKIKEKSISPYSDSYYNLYYLANNVSRICCYSCRYSSTSRVSDITIGDFWNIQNIHPDFDCKDGASVALINTDKGQRLINAITNRLNQRETLLQQAVSANGNLQEPCKMPQTRNSIYKEIDRYGYVLVAKKECHFQYIKPTIRRLLPASLKKFIKVLIR